MNVVEGEPADREMTTGKHTVRDISCCKCQIILGWKYVRRDLLSYLSPSCSHTLANVNIDQDRAFEPLQQYKEGKYILERNLLVDVQ